MSDRPTATDPQALLESANLRIDSLVELLEMENQAAEGEPISDYELEAQIARCIDIVMAQEESWVTVDALT